MDHKKLINDHWEYIQDVLMMHDVDLTTIGLCEGAYKEGFLYGLSSKESEASDWIPQALRFHYRTAYTHGQKHREQRQCKKETE